MSSKRDPFAGSGQAMGTRRWDSTGRGMQPETGCPPSELEWAEVILEAIPATLRTSQFNGDGFYKLER